MKKVILILIAVLFLVSSCQNTSQRGADINYKQGFIDVVIESEGNKEEYQQQPLQLPISIHNNLAYNIEESSISIKGFDHHFVEIYAEEQQLAPLEGRSIFNPEGMKEHLLFEGLIKNLLPGTEKEQEDYRIYMNYKSKVEFSQSICVAAQQSPGTDYEIYQGACTFQKEVSYNGQGAPLGVTALEIVPRQGRQVELRMNIENRGKGKVGTVTFKSATLGGNPLTCEFRSGDTQNSFRFEEEQKEEQKSATLVCVGYLNSDAAYTTPLFVELGYDYAIDQKEQLMILE